jgi:phosphonate transport system ATP-binding protein
MNVPAVELDRVSVRYGASVALSDVSFTLNVGETVGLLGQSGSGKSTLLSVCGGRVQASSGTVRVHGIDVLATPKWQRVHGQTIGFIPQQLHLVGRLRVIHNVNAGLLGQWSTMQALGSLIRPKGRHEVAGILDRVGVANKINERTDRLSGGEQQRVAVARTLRQDARILLADEPTASLDPTRALDVMQLLCGLARADERTLIASQHDIETALQTCDRLIGLRAGKLMFDLPTSEVTPDVAAALYAA